MNYIERVTYLIDKENRIIEVSNDWMKAALNGEAKDLTHLNSIIGKELFSYITDDATRMYYDVIFKSCRILKRSHSIAYRCDSPTHKRFMKMNIIPESDENLHIENYLVKEEPFENEIYISEDSNGYSNQSILRCTICNSLQLKKDGHWETPENLVKEKKRSLRVIHSVCPTCQDKE